jgi:hypothetical protein
MHNIQLLDNAQKYISITPQTKQADKHVTQTMQKRQKRQIPQTSNHTNTPQSRPIHTPTKNNCCPHNNRTSRNGSATTSRPRRLIPRTSRNRNGRFKRNDLETSSKRKKKSRPSPHRRTHPSSHQRTISPRIKQKFSSARFCLHAIANRQKSLCDFSQNVIIKAHGNLDTKS